MAGTSSPAPSSAPSTEHAARWANRQSAVERAELVDAYTPLVRRLAKRAYARRVGREVEYADLVQLGMVGLLEAIDRYTPARGVRFETYATYRIEGAILDGLSSYSELQRQLAFRREFVRDRAESLRNEDEVASKSALERLADLAIALALGFSLEADLEKFNEPVQPDNAYERRELAQLRARLVELVDQLPEGERLVIVRHYFQQQAFDEIARGRGLTKGRISQVHHSALRRLRERLREPKTVTDL